MKAAVVCANGKAGCLLVKETMDGEHIREKISAADR